MKVERLFIDGGLRVYDDFGLRVVERVSRDGETRIEYPGLTFDYDTAGRLTHAAIRVAESILAREKKKPGSPSELLDLAGLLEAGEVEIIARIDLAAETVTILREQAGAGVDGARAVYPLGKRKQIKVEVGMGEQVAGEIGLIVYVDEVKNRFSVGISNLAMTGGVGFHQPMRVNLNYLEGDLNGEEGLAKIKSFIKGEGF